MEDFCQARAVADRQGMFAPNPIEAFFSHAEGDDDIDVVAIIFLGGVFEGGGDFVPLAWIVVYDVGNFKGCS